MNLNTFSNKKIAILGIGNRLKGDDSVGSRIAENLSKKKSFHLIIDCEDSILIIEQVIMMVPAEPKDLYKRLLQMNRELVHGAFVMDADAEYILFRDTLQLENLDRNELEASLHALSLALAEYGEDLLGYVV